MTVVGKILINLTFSLRIIIFFDDRSTFTKLNKYDSGWRPKS